MNNPAENTGIAFVPVSTADAPLDAPRVVLIRNGLLAKGRIELRPGKAIVTLHWLEVERTFSTYDEAMAFAEGYATAKGWF